ncbi:MAG: Uma2 family endonuclease [Cyanobacteria bacterium P01_A01_bin.105]
MTLAEYLAYNDGTETRYELAHGILVEMPAENPLNNTIAFFLISYFLKIGLPYYCLANQHQIEVSSDQVTARQPGLTVHTEASAAAILKDGKLLRWGQPAPCLVIEVVSRSDTDAASRRRDYGEKRTEYAQRGIPEYWIVDPVAAVVSVLTLVGETYQDETFVSSQRITSNAFTSLDLTAKTVLSAGL